MEKNMRIMQVNNGMPIRQNTLNFRGGQLSLLEQIKKAHMELENRSLRDEAEKVYQTVFDEASRRLLGGSKAPEDVKALEVAGLSYARNLLPVVTDKTNPRQAIEAYKKIEAASTSISTVDMNVRGLLIKNPIAEMILELASCGLI
jgi:hypothetical protein